MAPNPRRIAQQLDELYAELPSIDCQRLCHDSCGIVPVGPAERARIERAAGKPLDSRRDCASCTMLTDDRRCSVYEIRPILCRLWGVVENLRCPYGCKPDRMLTIEEGYAFMRRAFEIGGYPSGWSGRDFDRLLAATLGPEQRRFLIEYSRPTVHGRRGALPKTVIER
jgi:Fe-S-cluster containining protein